MNDYFLEILCRQRQEEIFEEVRAIRISQSQSPRRIAWIKEIIPKLHSLLFTWIERAEIKEPGIDGGCDQESPAWIHSD